ncbi:winged helix-turn-helix transcriptional regulator [Mesorhizobium xinjiangense]|uniref:winged helix-turn-helix transcriptional regulator n=1 Tax=Mesorhizobium xinjiangense TaxID=2678685 RepID=UPI0012EE3059|nr:helix-turn-helix domain-containing protein [Mesorhizobium xinjiangense]
MERGGYGQFCPIAMASEILCSRWTTLLIREFLYGSTRFNELRRGVPRMSPALLSKRLKELQRAGVIVTYTNAGGVTEYRLSPAGEELGPIVMGIGDWGQRWVESDMSLRNLDPSLLMWDMRRKLDIDLTGRRRCTIHFLYPELPEGQMSWWIALDGGDIELCYVDPGFDIDLQVTSSLRTMTAIWMGILAAGREIDHGHVALDGDRVLAGAVRKWLGAKSAKEARKLGPVPV